MMELERLNTMDGYTFDEGVAILNLCNDAPGVVRHIAKTHNKSILHSRIHKLLRMPGNRKRVQDHFRQQPQTVLEVPEPPIVEVGPAVVPSAKEETKEDDEDLTDIVLTLRDVRTHVNTRYEDMPNEITQELWLKKQEKYQLLRQMHLKMRSVPEGEEHNEQRAEYRAEVLRLDKEVKNLWELIDAEIERFNAEKEDAGRADQRADKEPDFNISTYRAYVSKAVRKKTLTDAQKVELQHRVDAMIASGLEFAPEQVAKLKKIGIRCG